MSGNLWMFSDMLDDKDIEMKKHDFITLYQGVDYYGLGLKVFTRIARKTGSVYKIGKKVLICRTIFDEYLRKIYKKELEEKSKNDFVKEFLMKQGTMVVDEKSGRMDIRFGLTDYYGGLHCGECPDVLVGVQAEERFKGGDMVSGIYENCDVRLSKFEETGRTVLRVIIPDKNNRFPEEKECDSKYSVQQFSFGQYSVINTQYRLIRFHQHGFGYYSSILRLNRTPQLPAKSEPKSLLTMLLKSKSTSLYRIQFSVLCRCYRR